MRCSQNKVLSSTNKAEQSSEFSRTRSPYRKTNKLIPEDWDKELLEGRKKKELEAKKKKNERPPGRITLEAFRLMLEEIRWWEENPNACRHQKTFWYHDPHPQLLCSNCYMILEERKILMNDVGYGFKNHIKNGRKVFFKSLCGI